MRKRKLLALGLAGLMIISSAMPVFAADATSEPATGSISGTGTIEGYIDKDVFTVTLPTVTATNFSIDPQELKMAVAPAASKYQLDGADATAGYGKKVIFNYTPEGGSTAADYTKSASIKVVNKSTFDVDVKVDAAVTGLKTDDYDIALVEDVTADTVTGPAISLVLTDSTATLTGTTEASLTKVSDKKLTGTDSFTYKVAKSANVDNAYEVKNASGVYSYSIKSDVSAIPFNELVLNVSGAVKDDADWTDFNAATTKSLKLDVTYSVTKHVDNAAPVFTASTTEVGVINYTTGAGNDGLATITSIKMTNAKGSFDGYHAGGASWAAATDASGKITFDTKFVAYFNANATTKATITYETTGGETKTAEVNVKTKADAAP